MPSASARGGRARRHPRSSKAKEQPHPYVKASEALAKQHCSLTHTRAPQESLDVAPTVPSLSDVALQETSSPPPSTFIINVSSLAAVAAFPSWGVYCAGRVVTGQGAVERSGRRGIGLTPRCLGDPACAQGRQPGTCSPPSWRGSMKQGLRQVVTDSRGHRPDLSFGGCPQSGRFALLPPGEDAELCPGPDGHRDASGGPGE